MQAELANINFCAFYTSNAVPHLLFPKFTSTETLTVNYNSVAYANCFSETAVVFDEGKTHNGRKEIEHWIANANKQFKTVMKPINFVAKETTSILSAEISGTFEGSPVVLHYHFEFIDGLIQSLEVTG